MKSRTITGQLRVDNGEDVIRRGSRTDRAIDEIEREYGISVCKGGITDAGYMDPFSVVLTITGIEQRETVSAKWARALATVSAEYGLDCTWDETTVTEDGETVRTSLVNTGFGKPTHTECTVDEWVQGRRNLPTTERVKRDLKLRYTFGAHPGTAARELKKLGVRSSDSEPNTELKIRYNDTKTPAAHIHHVNLTCKPADLIILNEVSYDGLEFPKENDDDETSQRGRMT